MIGRFFCRLPRSPSLVIRQLGALPHQPKVDHARRTKLGCIGVFGMLSVATVAFIWQNCGPKRDENGVVIRDQYSGSWLAYWYRSLSAASAWKNVIADPISDVLLPPPLAYPYHQPKYTVVIELKNVLYHPDWTYRTGHRFKKRQAVDYFLDIVGYPNFELVVYTSELATSTEPIINLLDPKQKIVHRLYRGCTKYKDGNYLKDLNRLGRDLSKVIYIDFDPKAFQLNPENVLRIPEWKGDMNDTSLVDLAEFLKTMFITDVDDVRPTLQHYSQFDDPAKEFKRRAAMMANQQKEVFEARVNSEKTSVLKKAFGNPLVQRSGI